METLFIQYQNYIYLSGAFVLISLLGKLQSLQTLLSKIFNPLVVVSLFILDAHRGKDLKPSHDRILGSIVVANIIRLALLEKTIPEALMTMFWVLIGYQLVAKVLAENPAIMEFIRMKYSVPQKTSEAQ